MQNVVGKKIGVSPAYFVSLFGTGFTPEQVIGELDFLKAAGFTHVQLEVFESAVFQKWQSGGLVRVLTAMASAGLAPSVFVAHFLGHTFTSKDLLDKALGREGRGVFGEVLEMLESLDDSVPLALPLLPVSVRWEDDETMAADLVGRWNRSAADCGRALLLEVVPGSLGERYSRLLEDSVWKKAAGKAGLLLDTGHAHVTGEELSELVLRMRSRLQGVHLSDNDGYTNLSLAPGEGTVEWGPFLEALEKTGFNGSLDLEIVGNPENLRDVYKDAGRRIKEFLTFKQHNEGVSSWKG